MKNRLPAFTIVELMVVTLITTVVVMTAFSAFRIFESQLFEYTNDNQKATDLLTIRSLMKLDFLNANAIYRNANGFSLQGEEDSINYQLNANGLIIRQNARIGVRPDTFEIQIDYVISKMNEEEIFAGLINYFEIKTTSISERESKLIFTKDYSATDLFKSYGN